ncbi:hypothetical protein HN51_060335 [Arachis hypogaea]|uniref:Cleavage/polyadenylation specificity factor A subunit N-terminal domain-containing protein n=1 Tax=Arachis hypogaea TaxID=3818 RepID=A0A444X9C6_ARAHY|nr:uncharacterized protein LOC107623216 [Arachis ipaensis]XP_025681267.1 uncharacterized protein LOC112782851 isoform X1 [Arachis hypogaea]XP_025681268.1 uncharacterized protein LOC112782851 isoform X1 [Arachis hypogaea]RYQ86288.1 hypothetical protein Ahy_B10g105961 [Arachis hypogaea]
MVVVQGSKITLPNPCTTLSSILFEPTSLSLALTHSDSSLSLYPSLSLLSLSSLPSPQTLIPSPSSSSTFLLLQTAPDNINHCNSKSAPRVLFLVSAPHRAGSQILLRFYLLNHKTNAFFRPRVICSQKDLRFEHQLGVLVNSKHGVSIKLSGSVNYFAMYSVSAAKVWVFATKLDCSDDGDAVKLMRCAVIECSRPVWSVTLSFGFLLLGEENGVRVFSLRRIAKGRVKKGKNVYSKPTNGGDLVKRGGRRISSGGGEGLVDLACNGDLEGRIEKHGVAVKQTNVKLKHDDRDGGAYFVALKQNDVETKSMTRAAMPVKAISIQALSQRMFLILDSGGDVHLLSLSNSGIGVDITGRVRQLPHVMKVQNLAVLPDISTISQTVWISDGSHSVHMFSAVDMENALNEIDGNDEDEKQIHLPVIRVLFCSEKVQDVTSVASNSVMILGQGGLYAYAIS